MLLFLGTFKGNWNLPLLSARFSVMSDQFDQVARSSARRKGTVLDHVVIVTCVIQKGPSRVLESTLRSAASCAFFGHLDCPSELAAAKLNTVDS